MQLGTEINGRIYTAGTCECGVAISGQFLLPLQVVRCCDCADKADRSVRGWHPENSRD